MFIKRRSSVLYRDYGSIGLLTDNRNFGYKPISAIDSDIGDRIVDKTGTVFLSALGRHAIELDEVARRVNTAYPEVAFEQIREDAIEFFRALEHDGFIVSGEGPQECDDQDTRSIPPDRLGSKQPPDLLSEGKVTAMATQDFLDEHFNGLPQLTSLHIEITNRCNENCIHCYLPHADRNWDMNPGVFYDLIRQARDMNVLHVTLTGGEPMLHGHFVEYLRICKDLELSINVLSNLTLLNEQVLSEMRSNLLLGVQVSLYSMEAHIHDKITRVNGSFLKTRNAISALVENDIPVQVACPIMRDNRHCYHDVISWANEIGIHAGPDHVVLARHNHTTDNLHCRLSLPEVDEMLRYRIQHDTEYLEHLRTMGGGQSDIPEDETVCSVCLSSFCVNEVGNVYPCAGWQDYVVGNIMDTPLRDIWNNSERISYLRQLRRSDFPKCMICEDRAYCTMCMVRNANEDPAGNHLAVNEYYCSIARVIRAIATGTDFPTS